VSYSGCAHKKGNMTYTIININLILLRIGVRFQTL